MAQARRSCEATKTGGGDGNRTHVRIMSGLKRYMLSFRIYERIPSKTKDKCIRRLVIQSNYKPKILLESLIFFNTSQLNI